jgi:predicted nucleic acid-binding protein
MSAECFLDTNVLIYAFAADDPRSARAEALIEAGGVIGVQVINEFTNVTRRKLCWPWEQIEAALAVIAELLGPARALNVAIHSHAVALARSHTLAFYDALIVAAAIDARCRWLLSEDLQQGRQFGALTIENPFREA